MATVQLTPMTVAVHFTRAEKVWGLLRDVELPRAAVRGVDVVHDPLSDIRGVRAPGLALPGRWKIGTWRRRGERTVVSVRAGQPAVRLRLEGARYDTVLVGADDAATLARSLTPAV